MWFFILLLLSWTKGTAFFTQELHPLCLSAFEESPHQETLWAFFCGEKLPWGSWRWTISATGLIHLFVISGYHLGVTRRALVHLRPEWRYWATWTEFFLLLAYSLMSGFQPPVVRALVERQLRWRYAEWTAMALSPVLCLLLAPAWWNNLSLYLSVTARVAVFLCSRQSVLSQALLIPTLLAPLVLFAHPLGQFFAQLSIPFWLFGLFSQGILWLISGLVDHPWLVAALDTSSWTLEMLSAYLSELEKLYPPLLNKPLFFLKKLAPAYAFGWLGIGYFVFRKRWNEVFWPETKPKLLPKRTQGYWVWAWAIIFILIFSPQYLELQTKGRLPAAPISKHYKPKSLLKDEKWRK